MALILGLTTFPTFRIADYLCRCMALALAPHNVRVNAIGPGSIMTDVLAAVANDKAAMNK